MLSKYINTRLRHGSVIAFTGLMGSGKTGLMSLVAARQAFSGYRVAANYNTMFGDRIYHFEDLQAYNTCFALDEYQLTIGGRDFASQVNKDLSAWMELKIRKRDNVLLYTTQDIDMVDVNARRLLYRIYDCQLVQHSTGDYAKVAVFQNARYGVFTQVATFYLKHSIFYGIYDTKDENVILTPSNPDTLDVKKASRNRAPLASRQNDRANGGDNSSDPLWS